MTDLHIDGKRKIATVLKDDKIVKAHELTQDEFKELMAEMCGEQLGMIRLAAKLFKLKGFKFKDIE